MLKSKKIVISTHFLMYGVAHALRDYLISKKIDKMLFIALPFHTQKNVHIEYYEKGILRNSTLEKRNITSGVCNYILDIIKAIKIVIKDKNKYDLFVGFDNLNCLSGIFLKKLGRVRKVIYYSIDFVPVRFPNKLLNYIYHEIEKFAINNSDEVWNVSPRIGEGREEFLNVKNSLKQHVVPIGIWPEENRSGVTRKEHQIVFIGHILEKQGIQKVLEAIPDIAQSVEDLKFIIIGDGDYLGNLKNLVKRMRISKYVKFTGQIDDRKRISLLLSKSSLAVATYKPEKEKIHNFTYYADPTKIKDYLNYGLPIILTDVSYNADELQKNHCGVVVEYNSEKIAMAIKSLLTDKNKLLMYQKNAFEYSKNFNWNNIFNNQSI